MCTFISVCKKVGILNYCLNSVQFNNTSNKSNIIDLTTDINIIIMPINKFRTIVKTE